MLGRKDLDAREEQGPGTSQPANLDAGRTDAARAKRAAQSIDFLTLTLVPRDWDKPDPEGDDDLRGRGFMLHDSKGIGWRWDDPALGRCDVTITKVVGYKHHGHLQDERFAPGRTVSLKHEPNNPYDSNAVSVWDEQRDVQLGFVPKETAASIAEHFLGGRELDSVVLWEWVNRSDKDSRTGVRLLIAPKDRVTLQLPLS